MSLIKDIQDLLEELGIQAPIKTCICPNCGYETETSMGIPCSSIECPECGTPMIRKSGNSDDDSQNQAQDSNESVVKGILKFNAGESPTFDFIVGDSVIFQGYGVVDTIAKLHQLSSNPTAEDAVACAMDSGECEVEVQLEG